MKFVSTPCKRGLGNRKKHFPVVAGYFAGLALLVCVIGIAGPILGFERGSSAARDAAGGRELLSGAGLCDDGDLASWEKNGGLVVYILGTLFLFLGIAIVCDDFFVSSLESICERLGLSEDVAGATFMAAGSSAPELFSSLMSLLSSSGGNELGIGTIVGSAVFNVLVIIGATAVFSGQTLDLDWKPLTRDAFFYAASVGSIIVIFNDGEVQYWEGVICVLLYFTYILFMKYNEAIMTWVDEKTGKGAKNTVAPTPEKEATDEEKGPMSSNEKAFAGGISTVVFAHRWKTKVLTQGNIRAMVSDIKHTHNTTAEDGAEGKEKEDGDDDEEDVNPFAVPENKKEWPMWLCSLPWYAMFTLTIPNCQEEKWANYYLLTFSMSIAWIGAISYGMVEFAAKIGYILDVPNVIMGITVLAAGTSIPDAMSSIVVAKQGMGDMAVANAIGSNVFDIWLGLGLPWAFVLPFKDGKKEIIDTKQLVPNILILAGVLIVYMGTVAFSGWKLHVRVGLVFMFTYLIYVIYNIVFVWQMDIYGLEGKCDDYTPAPTPAPV